MVVNLSKTYWRFVSLKKVFVCVCIKCIKSGKKHTKSVKWKVLTTKDTFGQIEVQSDYDNWAQIFDKCDPKTKNTKINT